LIDDHQTFKTKDRFGFGNDLNDDLDDHQTYRTRDRFGLNNDLNDDFDLYKSKDRFNLDGYRGAYDANDANEVFKVNRRFKLRGGANDDLKANDDLGDNFKIRGGLDDLNGGLEDNEILPARGHRGNRIATASSSSSSSSSEVTTGDSEEVPPQDPAEVDELDPGTIDQLIELSSKLHLPADDVVDIIHDVEQKRKEEEATGLGMAMAAMGVAAPAVDEETPPPPPPKVPGRVPKSRIRPPEQIPARTLVPRRPPAAAEGSPGGEISREGFGEPSPGVPLRFLGVLPPPKKNPQPPPIPPSPCSGVLSLPSLSQFVPVLIVEFPRNPVPVSCPSQFPAGGLPVNNPPMTSFANE
ncbi:uncharacterized protein VK521_017580, partial [Ammospiza maritima maritima]